MKTQKTHSKAFFLMVISLISAISISCSKDDDNTGKELRYFRFSSCPQETHGNWQDTSFVAATSNPEVIAKCLAELRLPLENRTLFPLGKLAQGNAGYNKNASHNFSWHFIEDDWDMVEFGIEIYDGCAYTDAELADYLNTVERYGGWSNLVLEELQ